MDVDRSSMCALARGGVGWGMGKEGEETATDVGSEDESTENEREKGKDTRTKP